MMNLGDAKISGSGTIAGGCYRDVKISGSGNIEGDLHAQDVNISGSAWFRGSVASESVKVSGSAKFGSHVDTQDCKISGSTDVGGHLHARRLHASGSLSVREGIRAEEIKISGHLRAGHDVEAETFRSAGGFRIHGLLNASTIEVNMHGRCTAKEIGGDRVEVGVSTFHVFWRLIIKLADLFGFSRHFGFIAESVEATEVRLEWTEARIVRGNRVWIGPGCRVDLVEYTESAYVDPEANVKEVRELTR